MVDEDLDVSASESTGTLEEAASAFEAILSGQAPGKQKEPETKEAAKASSEAQADDDVEPEAPETAEEDGDDADDDGGDEGSDDEAEKKEDEAEDDKPLVTIEVDGKSIELTRSEIQSGYLRQADYTRKTQALAEERKQFSSELQSAQEERKVYAQLLPAMVQQMQASMPQAPDPSLIDTDPARYLKDRDAYERKLGDLQAAQAEQARMQQQEQEAKAQDIQAFVQMNAQKLPELVPEWREAKNYERDRPKVRNYLQTLGFSDTEIDQAYDARLVAMAYEAMRWRELKSSKPRADAPLEKAIKTSPPPAKPQTQKSRAFVEAKKRLRQTGSVRDAAAVFESLI